MSEINLENAKITRAVGVLIWTGHHHQLAESKAVFPLPVTEAPVNECLVLNRGSKLTINGSVIQTDDNHVLSLTIIDGALVIESKDV